MNALRAFSVVAILLCGFQAKEKKPSALTSLGNWSIRIEEAAIGPVEIITDGKESVTKQQYLKITVRIDNLNKNRNIDFDGWGSATLETSPDGPEVAMPRAKMAPKTKAKGHSEAGKIKPGESATAVLLFQPPKAIDKVRGVTLKFPFEESSHRIGFNGDWIKRPE